MTRDARLRADRRDRVAQAAKVQSGVLSRPQIRALGITADEVQAEVDGGRWQPLGRNCLLVTADFDVPEQRRWWLAVLAAAPRRGHPHTPRAALAGLTALQAAGLVGITGDTLIHVAAPKSSHPLSHAPGVRIHETRRWRDEDVIPSGIPRVRPAQAAIQAALWARTDREAALMLCTPIQQRLTDVAQVAQLLELVLRDRRKRFLTSVLGEIADGAHSLNELDFALMCRRRGLPEPDRQVLVQGPNGRAYLDVRWRRWRLVVEVDGVGHLRVDRWIDDSLRHNEIVLGGDTVLRIPSLGLRLDAERHLAAVERALRAAGWRSEPAARKSA